MELVLTVLGVFGIFLVVIWNITMFGGVAEIGNFIDAPTFTFVTCIFILMLVLAGKFKDFLKAFSVAIKKGEEFSVREIQKSILAMKTAIISVNIAGVLNFVVGLVVSMKGVIHLEEREIYLIWIAVALLCVVYALVATIIFIPIYMRHKGKLIHFGETFDVFQ